MGEVVESLISGERVKQQKHRLGFRGWDFGVGWGLVGKVSRIDGY